MNHETNTPRTDACPLCAATDDCLCFSGELKQELAASKAEVERLQSGFQGSCYCCEPVGILNQKLQAEVERLRGLLLVSDLPIEIVNNHLDK